MTHYSRGKSSMRVRLPNQGEVGEPFVKWLHSAAGRDRAKRLIVFLQQWDHQADELGRAPTAREYAQEWHESESGSYRLLEELREVFPTEQDPSRIMDLLWNGLPRNGELMALLDVPVIEVSDS
jgi:hypothetical protein